jgi:lipoprotein-releasing system permease protein
MKLEWNISNRYLLAKKRSGTSLIAKVAILGLILAVMTLITVLSVMNGFHKELRGKVLGAISAGYIASYDKFYTYKSLQKTLENQQGILATSPFIEDYGLISYGGLSTGINIRGIDLKQEKITSSILENIDENTFKNENIIIGSEIAKSINANIGDKITLITTKVSSNILSTTPRFKRFVISDIFSSGSEYDTSLVFITLNQAQRLFNLKNQITGLHLKVDDILNADKVIRKAEKNIDSEKYYGVSWLEQKRNFITALNLEKQMIGLILSLIVAVAVFNIISMMIMVVKDKQNDIAILRTFGFSKGQIKKTFFFLGLKIGLTGIIIGTILGVALASNIDPVLGFFEGLFGVEFFPADVFYISNFPSEVQFFDVFLVVSISFILVVLSSIYPAKNASKVNISQTLNSL